MVAVVLQNLLTELDLIKNIGRNGAWPYEGYKASELRILDSLGPEVGRMRGVRSWNFFLLNIHLMG